MSPQQQQLNEMRKIMRRLLLLVILAYVVLGAGSIVAAYFYSTTQRDFHQGSCKGRLLLTGLLTQSLNAAKAAPPQAFQLLSKDQTIQLYNADLAYNDISDCTDVQIPPPPPIPPFSSP